LKNGLFFQVEIVKFEDMKRKPEKFEGFKQNTDEAEKPEPEIVGPPIPRAVQNDEGFPFWI
jgi:hypothetical protein